MNKLSRDKQVQVLSALLEGCSIRSAERLTGVHRDTIMRLLVRAGRHCYLLMDKQNRNLQARRIECDELWCYVQKKDKRLSPEEAKDETLGSGPPIPRNDSRQPV